VEVAGAAPAPPLWPGGAGPTGVGEQGRCAGGFLRNVGSPVVSHGDAVWGKPSPKPLALPVFVPLGRQGAKPEAHRLGTAARRKRRKAGWMAGWLSALVVPLKRGNSSPEDPVEGRKNRKGAPGNGLVGGTRSECPGIRRMRQRNAYE